ncbi:MAG: PKD domain-containing protein [Microthrixaceae bacterium]
MTRPRPSVRRRTTGQAGLTLVELLLALVISGVVMVPLGAWAVSALGGQTTTRTQLEAANGTGLVTTWFTRDVTSASTVTAATASDCTGGGGGSGAGTTTVVGITRAGSSATRVFYRLAPADADASRTGLWRRACDPSGALIEAIEVYPNLAPGGAAVTCPDTAGSGAPDPCAVDANRQVQLTLSPADTRQVTVRATRRTDSSSIGTGPAAGIPPTPDITVNQLSGYRDSEFVMDASASVGRAGATISSVTWSFPNDAPCTAGDGTTTTLVGPVPKDAKVRCRFSPTVSGSGGASVAVTVTVTDSRGTSNTASTSLAIQNRFPSAAADGPTAGVARGVAFTLDASRSFDPDTADPAQLRYDWDLGDDLPDAERFLSGRTVSATVPTSALGGPRQVTLTVTDTAGAKDQAVVTVQIDGGQDTAAVVVTPAPVNVGGGRAPRVGTVGPGLPALSVAFTPQVPIPPGGTGWRLTRADGTEVALNCADPATCTHQFGESDAGVYSIVRLSGADASAPVTFRVNRAPTADIAVTAQAGTVPRIITFDSAGSTDADGTVLARRWNFGFFNNWLSSDPAPTQSFTAAGTYVVTLEVIDDDGAATTATRVVTVGSTPAAPAAPNFAGWDLVWDAVPGAQSYSVSVDYGSCGSPGVVTVAVPASPTPRISVVPPSVRCGTAGTVLATVAVRANDLTGPPSSPAGTSG